VSPLFVAVLAIVAFFGVASVIRWLRIELEHHRRPGAGRSKRPRRAP
jgi:hypothetical protein